MAWESGEVYSATYHPLLPYTSATYHPNLPNTSATYHHNLAPSFRPNLSNISTLHTLLTEGLGVTPVPAQGVAR